MSGIRINVQVIPSPKEAPKWAKVILRPARDYQRGSDGPCPICGTGEARANCRLCGGAGHGRFLETLRLEFEPADEQKRNEVIAMMESIEGDRGYAVQRTVALEETGGGLTNTGHATVVCGTKGERLKSIWGRSACGAPHAVFYPEVAMVVEYSHHRGTGSGHVYRVGIDRTVDYGLGVENEELWRFTAEAGELQEIEVAEAGRRTTMQFPTEAAQAAVDKSRCYHCRSAFYALDGSHGPNGALRGAGAANGGLPSPFKGPGIGYDVVR